MARSTWSVRMINTRLDQIGVYSSNTFKPVRQVIFFSLTELARHVRSVLQYIQSLCPADVTITRPQRHMVTWYFNLIGVTMWRLGVNVRTNIQTNANEYFTQHRRVSLVGRVQCEAPRGQRFDSSIDHPHGWAEVRFPNSAGRLFGLRPVYQAWPDLAKRYPEVTSLVTRSL